jgi:hypothetical protein
MLEETGFIAREEGDEFLILTCPECHTRIIFTQRVDSAVIHETANNHVGRCDAESHDHRPRVAEAAIAGR